MIDIRINYRKVSFFKKSGLLLAVGLAYLVKNNWRLLQALYSLPAVIFYIYTWAAPDSIRWYLANNKTDEAKR